jgi:hypothetical protein
MPSFLKQTSSFILINWASIFVPKGKFLVAVVQSRRFYQPCHQKVPNAEICHHFFKKKLV